MLYCLFRLRSDRWTFHIWQVDIEGQKGQSTETSKQSKNSQKGQFPPPKWARVGYPYGRRHFPRSWFSCPPLSPIPLVQVSTPLNTSLLRLLVYKTAFRESVHHSLPPLFISPRILSIGRSLNLKHQPAQFQRRRKSNPPSRPRKSSDFS